MQMLRLLLLLLLALDWTMNSSSTPVPIARHEIVGLDRTTAQDHRLK